MVEQTFVGDKPIDQLPSQTTSKIPDEELDKLESMWDSMTQPGTGKRAGIASRDPAGKLSILVFPNRGIDGCYSS